MHVQIGRGRRGIDPQIASGNDILITKIRKDFAPGNSSDGIDLSIGNCTGSHVIGGDGPVIDVAAWAARHGLRPLFGDTQVGPGLLGGGGSGTAVFNRNHTGNASCVAGYIAGNLGRRNIPNDL